MSVNIASYEAIKKEVEEKGATLVAVSKLKPVAAIKQLYDLGHRDFGENYVQELVDKHAALPQDIRWHFIGHLQSNKVKYIASFVHLIHGVDSGKLLKEINKQAKKAERTIPVLLQIHIAKEETKFGLSDEELKELLAGDELQSLHNIQIKGLMGMASFSEDVEQVRNEFKHLHLLYDCAHNTIANYEPAILSMGMSNDYKMALEEGSSLIRIGSSIFGNRQ